MSEQIISLALAAKLGSILVHVEEATSPKGHAFDARVALSLMADPEVVAFMARLRALALLPVKR